MSARTGDPVKTVVPKSYMASRRKGTQLGVLLVTSPAWPPVRCGRQGRAIVANQAST